MVNCFALPLWIPKDLEPSWRNYLIWTADWGGEHNTPDTKNTLIIFLSASTVLQVIFELKIVSALFLIAEIHSTGNSGKAYNWANNYFL